MGSAQSTEGHNYTIEVRDGGEGRSAVYRSVTHPNELVDSLFTGDLTTASDIFARGCRISRHEPCLGTRTNKTYQWLTYGEVERLSRLLGGGIMSRNLVPEVPFQNESYEMAKAIRPLGICSKNRAEWFITEIACHAYGIALVPLYDTLGDSAIRFIVEVTKMPCVAGSDDCLRNIVKTIADSPNSIESFICFDPPSNELKDLTRDKGILLWDWQSLIVDPSTDDQESVDTAYASRQTDVGTAPAGRLDTAYKKTKEFVPERVPRKEDVSTICFTSGTTGVPKGAIITHGAFASCIAGILRGPLSETEFDIGPSDTYMSYLPLAHVLERILANLMIAVGGKIAIFSGQTNALMEDIRLAKPTLFASVPRLFMRINDRINSGVEQNSPLAHYLFQRAVETKLRRLRTSGEFTHKVWDSLVFSKLKQLLGGQVRYMLSGGSALEQSIQERMAVFFSCPMLEGYGMTETLGASFIRRPLDSLYGHVGGCLPCVEFCLQSVPEMEYDASGKTPMGELLLRGPTVTPGYFQNPSETADIFTPDGWLRTGDIATILPGGRVKIIDRRKNIFKLSQGEYIVPDKIEDILAQAPLVSQIFVHGIPSKSSLVGVVCLDEEEVRRWIKTLAPEASKLLAPMGWEDLCSSAQLKEQVAKGLEAKATAFALRGFEKIKAFHIEPDAFSVENGMLTPTLKIRRPALRQKYDAVFQKLYADLGEP